MKKLKLFRQGVVELDFDDTVKINDTKDQVDVFLTFMYGSLPAKTFEALANRLGMDDDELSQICESASFTLTGER